MTLQKQTLAQLPPEIISQIASHAPNARFLRNLSLTSRSLHQVVEADGWNAFVANRFPSIPVPPYWRDASHALTTLSRNFDRRAFIAQDLGPDLGSNSIFLHELPSGEVSQRWNRPQGQTMGYQPVIDSYEEWVGNSWDCRNEIVAWGAGAEVVVQIVKRRPTKIPPGVDETKEERAFNLLFDKTGHSSRLWLAHRRPEDLEGRDDITSLSLINPPACQANANGSSSPGPTVDVIVGRASGGLEMLHLWPEGSHCVKTFDSGNLSVRSADTTADPRPLIGACLGDTQIALYSTGEDEHRVKPVSKRSCLSDNERGSRSWSARFLCHDKLAVGRGISSRIVYVYGVRPDGLSEEPIRSFGSCPGHDREVQTSAYPIIPVPWSATSREAVGDTFFSGGHDGYIRLHDMRSPLDCQRKIGDPVDGSAIFSLATVGRERLIAGASSHSLLKVFDLRMTGGRAYSYKSVVGEAIQDEAQSSSAENTTEMHGTGWNAFTRISNPSGMRRNRLESPIYSLSRPSPSSTSLYVGTENTVSHFNFTSMSDQHPDPVFDKSIIRTSIGRIDSRKSWNPRGKVAPLSMYERTGGDATGRLLRQKYLGEIPRLSTRRPNGEKRNETANSAETVAGYDERWHLV